MVNSRWAAVRSSQAAGECTLEALQCHVCSACVLAHITDSCLLRPKTDRLTNATC